MSTVQVYGKLPWNYHSREICSAIKFTGAAVAVCVLAGGCMRSCERSIQRICMTAIQCADRMQAGETTIRIGRAK